jgi:polar amino acid transport system substrate-binding protein
MRQRFRFTAGAAMALAIVLAGCTAAPTATPDASAPAITFDLVNDGEISVAMAISPPRITLDGEVIGGIEGEIVNRLAEKYGLKVVPFVTTFAGKLEAVQTGRSDVGMATYWTAERAQTFMFTESDSLDPSFFATAKDTPYTSAKSLDGKVVGSVQGYLSVEPLQNYFGVDNVLLFTDDAAGIQAVRNGQITAFFSGTPLPVRLAGDDSLTVRQIKTGDFDFPAERLNAKVHMFVSCANKPLADALNEVIDEMRDSGDLDALIDANFPGPGSIVTPKELPEDNCI